ncbi:MAG TPA: hypothetical protein PLP39_02845 [Flavobacterium lutivivi]|nr:hypothetical protein [Flavobacterium lutivivi]
MKKLLVILLAFLFLTSCGPRRMRCGPYRCSIEKLENKEIFC